MLADAGTDLSGPQNRFKTLLHAILRNPFIPCFLLLVVPLGVAMAVITPPGMVPDETSHMVREYGLMHGHLIGARRTIKLSDGHVALESGMLVNGAIIGVSTNPWRPQTAAAFARARHLPWASTTMFGSISPIAIYFPVFYIPAALGFAFSILAGCSPFLTMETGRLATLLVYALLGTTALKVARRGQGLMFLALSMPLSISLGASCNPDGLLIATATLSAALISRGSRKSAAIAIAMVILAKPPYALLALPLLFPLPSPKIWLAQRRRLLQRGALVMITILPAILWLAYAMTTSAAPADLPPYHPGPLWQGNPATLLYATDPAAQLRVVVTHPLRVTGLILHGFFSSPFLFQQMIGTLGWMNIILPSYLYTLWGAGIVCALIADTSAHGGTGPAWHETVILLCGIGGTIFLIWLSQYLVTDNVGLNGIFGPTGRYLVPLVPMLGLALPHFKWNFRPTLLYAPACAAAFFSLLTIPSLLAACFP